MKEHSKHRMLVEKIGSASIGALLTSLIVTPLEVVKIRLQSQASIKSGDVLKAANALECTACKDIMLDNTLLECRYPKQIFQCREHVVFSGTFDALQWIVRREGVGSLFNGLSATLWMSIPATVLYFASYEELRDKFNRKFPSSTSSNPLFAGALARILAATAVAPLELIRTNAQAEARPPSIMKMARTIVQTKGIAEFWRGLSPTLWRDVPFSALYWMSVEKIRASDWIQQFDSKAARTFVAGCTSGTMAALLTHPFDVIKTRRQVFDLANRSPPTKSTFLMMLRIVQSDGIAGLYVGVFPRVIKIAPSTAIMLTSYELGKRFFHDTDW